MNPMIKTCSDRFIKYDIFQFLVFWAIFLFIPPFLNSQNFNPSSHLDTSLLQTADELPELISPDNGAREVDIDPVLIWSKSSDAVYFHLQVSSDENFNQPILNDSLLTDSVYHVKGLERECQYFWRVHLIHPDTSFGWSDVFSFTTLNGLGGWIEQNSPVYQELRAVNFLNEQHGFAVGQNGVILQTTNGGARWIKAFNPVQENLTGISFIDSHRGWICGAQNTILNTNDGGKLWQAQGVAVSVHLESIQFIDSLHGFAAGDRGIILKTTDGGRNWQEIPTVLNNSYLGMHFISPESGWVVGNYWNGTQYYAVLIKTMDGGNTWTSQTFCDVEFFTSVFFLLKPAGCAAITVLFYRLQMAVITGRNNTEILTMH